jgi:xylan 1,4-beta-xylosidase
MTDTKFSASRRDAIALGLTAAGTMALPAAASARGPEPDRCVEPGRAHDIARGAEGQRSPDLADGRFINPVLAGDRADPTILKDGDDYYATFTSFTFYPGVVIWHSRDLINWAPIGPALTKNLGSVYALDIAKHDGRYFIYIPVNVPPADGVPPEQPFRTYVIHAESMRGPWSEPIDLKINGYIDPGHAVGEDEKRYLFFNEGMRVQLRDDGLATAGKLEKVYDGWPIPEEWVIEGVYLEGPKLLRHNGWFYMFSGEGGTAGPPTSHMVIVARSRSIHGPWENCPHNPIVRTAHRDEPWWSRGHATPVQGPAGDWWMVYHGYENGFRTLGRQMLLEPFEWTQDGWPRARGGDLGRPLPKPRGTRPSQRVAPAPSGPFSPAMLGAGLAYYDPAAGYQTRASFAEGALRLRGQGKGPADSSPLALIPGDRSYSVSLDIEVEGEAQGGLLLFYNSKLFCGGGLDPAAIHTYKGGKEVLFPPAIPAASRRMRMRVVNVENVCTFAYAYSDDVWHKLASFEVSSYNHNVADGFLSLKPALFASGSGAAVFRNLVYSAKPEDLEIRYGM